MPVGSNGNGPSYISNHSADVILSDIRPIKLKVEGLRCINVFLDEFLYSILKAAHSLTTDKLRAGLLSVLPTSLGKEALLEAEVELRAYWDRTKSPKGGAEDDSGTFNLQWAFELLRLKCEAYSTLNESDGDKLAESRLYERLTGTTQPPKQSLVAPAALYLTAILEAICEHVLSNVGRVASRDSSRTYASVQDVFIALCEDETVYSLFKSMGVYEQIEQLSQAPKPRRSFSRNDKSRTSTSHSDQPSGKDSPTPAANRLSTEGTSNRSSFDRKSKKFLNGRNSSSNESSEHKRSNSALSEETRQTVTANNSYASDAEEQASLQEFDDLMRSDSTMKVSLTPDRLKTMELFKQEKFQRGGRPKPPPLQTGKNFESETSTSSAPRAVRRPSALNVAAIVEDDEEPVAAKPVQPRMRQASVASPPPKAVITVTATRTRSHSAAAPSVQRKSSKTALQGASSSPVPMMTTREFRGTPQGFDAPGFPQKTRKIQRAPESLDLDDVMAGSDDEDLGESPVVSPSKSFASNTPSSSSKVSARTRDLMDFLNEGPPTSGGPANRPPVQPKSPAISRAGRELMDFLNEGPPDFGPPPSVVDNTSVKSNKGSGRLQRMISKLKLSEDKRQQPAEDFSRKTPVTPSAYSRPPLVSKISNGNLPVLGNYPIPPRPPQPQMISPPSSPIHDSVDLPSVVPPPPASSLSPSSPRPPTGHSSVNRKAVNLDQETVPSLPASVQPTSITVEKREQLSVPIRTRPSENVRSEYDLEDTKPLKSSSKPPVIPQQDKSSRTTPDPQKSDNNKAEAIQNTEAVDQASAPESPGNGISITDAQDMKRLLMKATTPEECRLIMDMFMAKAGIPVEPTEYDIPYPSPSSEAADSRPSSSDIALEISLVELFLGGEPSHEPIVPRKKRYTTKKVKADTQTANGLQKPPVISTNGHANSNVPLLMSIPVSEVALKA